MKREIIFSPRARLEFEDAAAWYESQQSGLSEEFQIEVHDVLQQVLRFPQRYRLASPTTYKIDLKRFHKYSIYYSIELNAIYVISVFHGARNPAELRRRLK